VPDQDSWRKLALFRVPSVRVHWTNFPQEKRCPLLCQLEQLSARENYHNRAAYAITISYLGRPALTLRLCKLHILDTWNRAQQSSGLQYGNDGHVKAVAVKKL